MTASLKELKEATNRLVDKTKQREPLPPAQGRTQIAEAVSLANPQKPSSGGTGQGIDSPLIEQRRTNSDAYVELFSTDGFTVIRVPKQVDVTMQDASKRQVMLRFVNG